MCSNNAGLFRLVLIPKYTQLSGIGMNQIKFFISVVLVSFNVRTGSALPALWLIKTISFLTSHSAFHCTLSASSCKTLA